MATVLPPTYTVEVFKAYPKVKNKDGEEVVKPVTIRRLTITGDMVFTTKYKVNLTIRRGVHNYTVHRWAVPPKAWWDNSTLVTDGKFVKDGVGQSEKEVFEWLGKLFRNYDIARKALQQLKSEA